MPKKGLKGLKKMKTYHLFMSLIVISVNCKLSDGFNWILQPQHKKLAHIGSTVQIMWHYNCTLKFGSSEINYESEAKAYRGNNQEHSLLKNTVALFSVSGGSNVTVIIGDIDKDKRGKYCCKVFCDSSFYQKCTTLVIYALPRITYMTSSLHAKQGDSVTLKCNASGHPAPRATWIHNDTNMVIANSSVTSFSFTGKASGQYCCHASNGYGGAINCTSVEVLVLPRIPYLTQNLYAKQRDSIPLKCNASGHPAPRATWVHKDNNTVIAHSFLTSLNITGKTTGGQYCCHVSNGYGNATNCTSIIVTEYQPINTELISHIKFLTRNKRFKVTCKADASPPAVYFIQPENRAMVSSSDGNVTITTPVDRTSITISCIAKNKYGEGNVVYLKIPIYKSPTILTHWDKPVVMMNESFAFHCEATGFPTPSIIWHNATNNKTFSSKNGMLNVKNEDCENETLEYYCMAANIVKNVTTFLKVQVICKNSADKDGPGRQEDAFITKVIIVIIAVFAIFFLTCVVGSIVYVRQRQILKSFDAKDDERQRHVTSQAGIPNPDDESPYGEPIDAVRVINPNYPLANHAHADYATVEETGYRPRGPAKPPRHTKGYKKEPEDITYASILNSRPSKRVEVEEPVYAKVNKEKKDKKDKSADIPLNPLYAEIQANAANKPDPSTALMNQQDSEPPDNKNITEEDGVDSSEASCFSLVY